jgi:hypothetical protein
MSVFLRAWASLPYSTVWPVIPAATSHTWWTGYYHLRDTRLADCPVARAVTHYYSVTYGSDSNDGLMSAYFPSHHVTAGTWAHATLTLTSSTTFTNYIFQPGDILYVTGGTGTTVGPVRITSRVSANAITLAANIGPDTTDVVCSTGPKQTLAAAQADINASGGNFAAMFRGGDVWRTNQSSGTASTTNNAVVYQCGLDLGASGVTHVTLGSYPSPAGTQATFSAFSLYFPDGVHVIPGSGLASGGKGSATTWTVDGTYGNCYDTTEATAIAAFRNASDPLGQLTGIVFVQATSAADCNASLNSWFQTGSTLMVNYAGGSNPNGVIAFEATVALASGVSNGIHIECSAAYSGALPSGTAEYRIDSLNIDGWGTENTNTNNGGYSIGNDSEGAGEVVISNCGCYWNGSHAIGSTQNGASGIMTVVGTRVAYTQSSGPIGIVYYAAGGGQECISDNDEIVAGGVPCGDHVTAAVATGGVNYTVAPTVTFACAAGYGSLPLGTVTIPGGVPTITVTYGGCYCLGAVTATFSGGTGGSGWSIAVTQVANTVASPYVPLTETPCTAHTSGTTPYLGLYIVNNLKIDGGPYGCNGSPDNPTAAPVATTLASCRAFVMGTQETVLLNHDNAAGVSLSCSDVCVEGCYLYQQSPGGAGGGQGGVPRWSFNNILVCDLAGCTATTAVILGSPALGTYPSGANWYLFNNEMLLINVSGQSTYVSNYYLSNYYYVQAENNIFGFVMAFGGAAPNAPNFGFIGNGTGDGATLQYNAYLNIPVYNTYTGTNAHDYSDDTHAVYLASVPPPGSFIDAASPLAGKGTNAFSLNLDYDYYHNPRTVNAPAIGPVDVYSPASSPAHIGGGLTGP